ncbi:hypothetical protein [Atlantibacter sp.]|uniref:hypothetical protein n=1 Tax=Atlantibacter sp. TaxID=1903473 RepID=UPI0028ACB3DD|nr:hypothetical protein [Atlantibacter sp.]
MATVRGYSLVVETRNGPRSVAWFNYQQRAGVFLYLATTPPGKKPPQRCTSPVKLAENILRKDLFRNHGLLSVCFLPNSPFNPSAMAMFCQAFYLHKKAAGCYACGQFGRMLPSQQR